MFLSDAPKSLRAGTIFRMAVAALCVVLILFVGAADLLHTHASEGPAAASCSLCAVAHLAAAPAPVAAALETGEALRPVPNEPPLAAASRACWFALYVRPPPAV